MSRPIAYVCSRFPALREAFIIREVRALEKAGIDVRVYSLKRPDEGVSNRDYEALRNRPYYSPHLVSGALLRDNAAALLARPLRYVATPLAAAWRFRPYPLQAAKCVALYPKMVHYARHMKRAGAGGAVSCWASLPTLLALVGRRLFDLPFGMTCRAWDIFVPMNQADLPVKVAAASLVRANNDAGAAFMKRFCPSPADEAKIRRVYNPFDVAALTPRAEPPGGRAKIVSGGSLVEQKGLAYLLQAVASLRDDGFDCDVVLVGEGAERPRLEELARERRLEDRVVFAGTLPNHRFLEEMRSAHAFVLPSVPASSGCMDGIPNVLIESMALGVPAISTSISGIPELVRDGVTGLLVPPRDVGALAAAIRRLLADAALQRSLATAGRRRVEELFEMDGNARQLIEAYRATGLLA